MEPYVIELGYPFEFDGKPVRKLVIKRRAKARDLVYAQDAAKSPAGQEVHLAAAVAGVNPLLLEEMDAADYMRVSRVVNGFLLGRRESGEKGESREQPGAVEPVPSSPTAQDGAGQRS